MHIRKGLIAFFVLLSMGVGFGVNYLVMSPTATKSEFTPTTATKQFEQMSSDSLFDIRQTLDDVIETKSPTTMDTLEQLGRLKDSLQRVAGGIRATMRIAKTKQEALQLDSALNTTEEFITELRKVIMDGSLELLRPSNTALRTLIKDMKEKTEKLQKLATTIATISDIISTLTTILASPFLNPVSASAET